MQQLQPNTTLQSGKYKIIRTLGQGGFGITYLAKQRVAVEGPLGKIDVEVEVTIKEFFMKDLCNRDESTKRVYVPSWGSAEFVEKFKKKFLKEAVNISKLNHPNIIKVLDVFEENGTAYYVMEYIQGGSLSDLIKEKGCFSEEETLCYTSKIASALRYIHAQKMNHLDIKPANVLLRPNGDVVLIDFGLSKNYDVTGEQTTSTPVGVSVGYAPIEQSRVGGVGSFSPATDIYSLGATMYKMLTGETPPEASAIIDDGLPPMPSYISASVKKAIESAMQVKKMDRPQSINEFMMCLQPSDSCDEEKVVRSANSEDTILLKEQAPDTISQPCILANSKTRNVDWEKRVIVIGIVAILVTGLIVEAISSSTQKHYVERVTGDYIWEGKLDEEGKPTGWGVAVYAEGDKEGRKQYTGLMIYGDRQDGTLTYTNGDSYVGTFKANNFDKGTYTVASSGEKFVGTFDWTNIPYNGKWYDKNNQVIQEIVDGRQVR